MADSSPTGIRLRVRVQPRASRNEIAGVEGDVLRIRLTAPPVEGAANEALIRFLAERLGVSPSAVRLVAGASGRNKIVEVSGVDALEAARLLQS